MTASTSSDPRYSSGVFRKTLCAVLALSIITLLVTLSPWRFTVVAENALRNVDFSQGGTHWVAYGNSIRVLRGPPPTIAMEAGSRRVHWFGQRLPLRNRPGGPGFDHYRVHAEAATHQLEGARHAWQGGRLAVVNQNQRGQRLWYMPEEVLRLEGTTEWRVYSTLIPASEDSHATWLAAVSLGTAGYFYLRSLRVELLRERPSFRVASLTTIALWAGLVIFLIWRLWRIEVSVFARLVCISATLCVSAAALAPQPHLNNALSEIKRYAISVIDPVEKKPQPRASETTAGDSMEVEDELADSTQAEDSPSGDGASSRTNESDGDGERASGSPETDDPGEPTAGRGAGEQSRTTGDSGPARTQSRVVPPKLPPPVGSDKLGHVVAFSLLAFLWVVACRHYRPTLLITGLLTFSASIQVAQFLSITREPDWQDFLADSSGVIVGTLAALLTVQIRERFRRGAGAP